MTQTASQRNPFMLMISPELVLAAIEKSERLDKLNRHLCRPLDRQLGVAPGLLSDAHEETESGSENEGDAGIDG